MEKKKSLKILTTMLIITVFCAFVIPSFMLDSQVYAASKTHLSKTSISLDTGDSQKINLILPSGKKVSASKVTWKTSSSKVASVKKGKITGKSEGSCTITAKYKGKKYKCTVDVKTNYAKNSPEENLQILAEKVRAADSSFASSNPLSTNPKVIYTTYISYSPVYQDLTFRVTSGGDGIDSDISATYHLDTEKWTTVEYKLDGKMKAQMHTTENFDPSTFYDGKVLSFAFDNMTPTGIKSPVLETACRQCKKFCVNPLSR